MANSMTGYGRASETLHSREITVELRSVNHRYLEVSVRAPRSCMFLEEKLKSELSQRVSRGKFDIALTIVSTDGAEESVQLNMQLARSYYDAIKKMSDELGIDGSINAVSLARFPDVFVPIKEQPDEDELWQDVKSVLTKALDSYCRMRAVEGERLAADMLSRIDTIETLVGTVEAQSAERLERYREKLSARMKTVLESTEIDESRILLEAAIYADRSAVDEETVRLRSHLAQFRDIMKSGVPVGRKLDFLIQEINREANTIGSKAGDLEITSAVVDIKAEIEKIREQVQNVE